MTSCIHSHLLMRGKRIFVKKLGSLYGKLDLIVICINQFSLRENRTYILCTLITDIIHFYKFCLLLSIKKSKFTKKEERNS